MKILLSSEEQKIDILCNILRFYTKTIVYTSSNQTNTIDLIKSNNFALIIMDSSIIHNKIIYEYIKNSSDKDLQFISNLKKRLLEIFDINEYNLLIKHKPLNCNSLISLINDNKITNRIKTFILLK